MNLFTFIVLALFAVGMNPAIADIPSRVISLDYCADQFVLKLLPKERILALSTDSKKEFSYMRAHADGIPQVRASIEDLLILSPDMIIRSYGGAGNMTHFLNQVDIPLVQMPVSTPDIDSIRRSILFVASQLGVPQRGEEVVAEMDRQLNRIAHTAKGGVALYMTPTGYTGGSGTLIDDIFQAAGYQNFEARAGWWPLPLERLAYEKPDLVVAGFFDGQISNPNQWSAMRHPIAKRQLSERPSVFINGAWLACGGWFIVDAIAALAAAPEARSGDDVSAQ